MDNPEKMEHRVHKKQDKDKHNNKKPKHRKLKQIKKLSNTDPTKNPNLVSCVLLYK